MQRPTCFPRTESSTSASGDEVRAPRGGLALHKRVLATSGGGTGVRDPGALRAAIEAPRSTFDGIDLYPSLVDKAAALAHGLVSNHPFVDGNKRVGHAAMEVFLLLNGHEMEASVDEQVARFLSLAAGQLGRAALAAWLQTRVVHSTRLSEE